MNDMKICIVLPHFFPYVGGGEKLFYDLALGLLERGHEVRVIAEKVDYEYNGYKKVNGIDVWYCSWKAMFGHPLPKAEDIEEHIKWCDVVHTSIFTPAHIVSKLSKKYNKPSVMTVHEVRGTKWYWADDLIHATGFFIYEQYVCRQKFSVYHAVSESTKRDFYKFCGRDKNVIRVYNANEMEPGIGKASNINLRKYFEIDAESKVFLYYGRAGKTKGIYVYLEAIDHLNKMDKIPDQYKFCFIVGKEPADLRKKFIEKINKLGLAGKVIVKESLSRPDLCKCIEQSDYVVVPSLTEGFGFSALEACQMNKPLIHSDGCSLPEVVYGKCIAFENRNAEDLSEKLDSVIQNGIEEFATIPDKTFTYEEMIEGIVQIYQDLCVVSNNS